MEQVEVVIPDGVQTGDNITFTLSNNKVVQFVLPRNVIPGQRVLMQIPIPTRLENELTYTAQMGAPIQQQMLMDMYQQSSTNSNMNTNTKEETIQIVNIIPIPRVSSLIQDNLIEIIFNPNKKVNICGISFPISIWFSRGYMKHLANYPNNSHIRHRISPVEWKHLTEVIIKTEQDVADEHFVVVLLVERYGWVWSCIAIGIAMIALVGTIPVLYEYILLLITILILVSINYQYGKYVRIREVQIASSIASQNKKILKPIGLSVSS